MKNWAKNTIYLTIIGFSIYSVSTEIEGITLLLWPFAMIAPILVFAGIYKTITKTSEVIKISDIDNRNIFQRGFKKTILSFIKVFIVILIISLVIYHLNY